MLGDLILLCVVVLVGMHFWQTHGVREIALRETVAYCRRQNLLLLDQSVSLRAVWFKRDPGGKVRFWRAWVERAARSLTRDGGALYRKGLLNF